MSYVPGEESLRARCLSCTRAVDDRRIESLRRDGAFQIKSAGERTPLDLLDEGHNHMALAPNLARRLEACEECS